MDLNTMYQNGMGPMASFFAGQSAVKDQQMADANLRAKQMENDQASVMNPLNAQFRQGQINQQGAELPGITGQSQSLAAQGSYDTQTLVPKVAARFSQLGDQIGADGMRQMGRDGEIATQIAPVLKQFPPALHKEVASRMFQMYGGSPDSPILKGMGNVGDADVAKSLATVGAGMALASQDYLTKSNLEKQKTDSEERIAKGHDATSTTNANIMANSRTQSATIRAQQLASTMGVDKAIAHYEMLKAQSGGNLAPEDEAALNSLKVQQLQAHAAGAPAVAPTTLGQPTPLEAARGAVMNPPPGATPTMGSAPPGAISMLKANPHLRPQFEAKYGEGSAKKILGY